MNRASSASMKPRARMYCGNLNHLNVGGLQLEVFMCLRCLRSHYRWRLRSGNVQVVLYWTPTLANCITDEVSIEWKGMIGIYLCVPVFRCLNLCLNPICLICRGKQMVPSEKLSWELTSLRRFESHLPKKGHLALLLPCVAAEFASFWAGSAQKYQQKALHSYG